MSQTQRLTPIIPALKGLQHQRLYPMVAHEFLIIPSNLATSKFLFCLVTSPPFPVWLFLPLTQLIYTECSDAHTKPRPIWTILSTLCGKTPLLPLHGGLLPWGSWDSLLSCDFSRFWFADWRYLPAKFKAWHEISGVWPCTGSSFKVNRSMNQLTGCSTWIQGNMQQA